MITKQVFAGSAWIQGKIRILESDRAIIVICIVGSIFKIRVFRCHRDI
jgi:hypothetical protein